MGKPWYVIGGGIIGLLSAYELRLAGEAVVVLDRQAVGREASWAGGGILSPLYPWRYPEAVNRLAQWSQRHYRSLVDSLLSETGIDAEWIQSGMMILDAKDSEIGLNWCRSYGIQADWIEPATLGVDAQWLRSGVTSALKLRDVAQIRNPRLLNALAHRLRALDVEIREGTAVTGFRTGNGRLAAILLIGGEEIPTERCLIAAGPWSQELLASVGLNLPLRPVRGQMLVLSGGKAPFKEILIKNSHYLIPRRDGRILVGSTQEEVGFDKSTTASARSELYAAAADIVPELGDWVIEHHWAGLRPGSTDGIPYIGRHPELSGLFINTGHFRNGIVLAPGSARLVADLILGRSPIVDPNQYGVLRP